MSSNETKNPCMDMVKIALEQINSLEVLDKIVDVYERFEANEARKKFFKAMSAFQGEIPAIELKGSVDYKMKNSSGRVSFKYAFLDDIVKAVQKPMAKHGFSFMFDQIRHNNGVTVTMIITHEDGHCEKNTFSGPPDTSGSKDDLKSYASTNSYLKRYAFLAGFGIVPGGEDDDGNGFLKDDKGKVIPSSKEAAKPVTKPAAKPQAVPAGKIKNMLAEFEKISTTRSDIEKHVNIKDIYKITQKDFVTVCDYYKFLKNAIDKEKKASSNIMTVEDARAVIDWADSFNVLDRWEKDNLQKNFGSGREEELNTVKGILEAKRKYLSEKYPGSRQQEIV